MEPVLSYSEDAGLAGEVATAAAGLAQSMGADSKVVELDQVSPGLRCQGGVVVLKAETALEGDPDSAAGAIAGFASSHGFSAILIGDTRFGTLVAGKVAARLKVGALGKGKKIRADEKEIVIERDVYGGRYVAQVSAPAPCVALVQRGGYAASEADAGPVETIAVKVPEPKVTILELRQLERGGQDVKSASIVVSAGRGFAKKEDLALAVDLSHALGAALGCSRPLSSDLGWLGEEAHIGLTGAYVHPKLYLAVGISGQLQHVAGIKDSKVIVAINKDPQAPIFQYSDYGIVGDLYAVLPAITKALKRR